MSIEHRALEIGYEQMRERAEKAEAEVERLKVALDGVYCATNGDGEKCWCAYEQLIPQQQRPPDPARDCKHGRLKRKCEECADEVEIARHRQGYAMKCPGGGER